MNVVSQDFASALRELRGIVSALQQENQQLKQSVANIQKQLDAVNDEAVTAQNFSVLAAASRGDQAQLRALQHQPLTNLQSELVRLYIDEPVEPAEIAPVNPQMLEAFIDSRQGQSLPQRRTEATSITQRINQQNRMQRLAEQLEASTIEHARRQSQQRRLQEQSRSNSYAQPRGSNALTNISSTFHLDDF